MIEEEQSPWLDAEVSASTGAASTSQTSSFERVDTTSSSSAVADNRPIPQKVPIPLAETPEAMRMEVDEPQKHGTGLTAYVTYRVASRDRQGKIAVVRRRYRDFVFLAEELQAQFPGRLVPQLPEKHIKGLTDHDSPQFTAMRARALTKFLTRISRHPELREYREVQEFLNCSDSQFEAHARQVSEARQGGIGQRIASLTTRVTELVKGDAPDADTPPELARQLRYLIETEERLNACTASSNNFLALGRDHAAGALVVGMNLATLGSGETMNTGVVDTLVAIGEGIEKAGEIETSHREKETAILGEGLHDLVRQVKSAKELIKSHHQAKDELQRAIRDLHNRQSRLSRISGKGSADKVIETQQRISQASDQVDGASSKVQTVEEHLDAEMDTFYHDKHKVTREILVGYVRSQLDYHRQMYEMWQKLVPAVQKMPAEHVSDSHAHLPMGGRGE